MNARLWMCLPARGFLCDVRPAAVTCLAAALAIGLVFPAANLAQRSPASRGSGSAATAAPVQKIDEEYTKKIREFTTEKFFLTEMVDHLPASATVPTPEKVLGYAIGTPDKLTYSKDIYRYFYALEKASPRVRVFNIGKTEEGRDTLLVAISDEANIKSLDRLQEITAKLGDPRKLKDDAEAEKLIAEGKPFYWASGSIHSPETGSPEMLMELGYRLAVEEAPFIRKIRENSVVLITPMSEVDGRDREVDVYNYHKAFPNKQQPNLLYWGKYVAHDNNRDGLSMALALSRNMMGAFLQWHPTILHDLHESVPFLYTSTGTGPYNAWLDPIVVDEWHLLAYHEIEEMTKRGVPGVWTHGFYDGWAPNYMFYIANGHNSIGRFYETFGGRGADTGPRTVGDQSNRDWYRPNPPLSRVNWSIRNNINLQQSGVLLAMNFVASNKERFLRNFYLKSKRSIEKANNEGPVAWVIPGDDPRPGASAELVNLLKIQGVEVHVADQDFEVTAPRPASATARPAARRGGGTGAGESAGAGEGQETSRLPAQLSQLKFVKGSYVIRMDQPYSRMADMLLDTQYYNVNDPRPYDDTGWTLGPLKNVKTVRVTDRSVLKVPMTMLTGPAKVRGGLAGAASAQAFVINHNTDNALMTLRYQLKDIKMHAAEDNFKAGERSFNAGSFIIKTEGAPADLRDRLSKAVEELGLTAVALDEVPKAPMHELAVPRIAILHTWQNTQNEGWFRIAFDTLSIPYSYISDHTIRDTENLRDKYDVIIFPPVGGSAQSIVRGLPMRGDPIPWKGSDITPNLAKSPDTTDDMRGGMGLEGVMHLQKFIEDGGLFITVGSNSAVPIDFGLVEGINIQPSRQLQARGSVYNAQFADKKSPIAYGYGDSLAVYFNQAPLFQVSALGGIGGGFAGFGGGGTGTSRPSGRGSLSDPDIPQGRPYVAPPPPPQPGPGGEPPLSEDVRQQFRNLIPPPHMRPRTVLRFAAERDLLVSGMLAGGSELANRPAVVDVPFGKGHVVFFANNPMWRQETHGSFFLLFNAALHFNHLSAGVAQPGGGKQETADDLDQDDQGHFKH